MALWHNLSETILCGVGKWLPQDPAVTQTQLEKLIAHVDESPKQFESVIVEFQQLIENDPVLLDLFTSMFTSIPNQPPYTNDPTGQPQVRTYLHMLQVFNYIITRSIPWNDAVNDAGFAGFPINAILHWPMSTAFGFVAFGRDDVNAIIGKMLKVWGEYLKSPASVSVLHANTDGWLSPNALKASSGEPADGSGLSFEQTYNCDPNAPHYGFKSWDDFFTRTFKEGIRPIASPDDDGVIVNACECAPYRLATNVATVADFWIKGQPYSLSSMMADDPHVPKFAGGTVYQAYLNALSYHRWNSPVSGTIISTRIIPGTYYQPNLYEGFTNPSGPDPASPCNSQGYISAVATRALILIEADNEEIGLLAFLAIGMTEVSSCEPAVEAGQHVKKGDEIGSFHFGGSSCCLIFRSGVELEWVDAVKRPFSTSERNIKVCDRIARVIPGQKDQTTK